MPAFHDFAFECPVVLAFETPLCASEFDLAHIIELLQHISQIVFGVQSVVTSAISLGIQPIGHLLIRVAPRCIAVEQRLDHRLQFGNELAYFFLVTVRHRLVPERQSTVVVALQCTFILSLMGFLAEIIGIELAQGRQHMKEQFAFRGG